MRIIEFIKWWWRNNDGFTRTIACLVIFSGIPALIAGPFLGKIAVLAFIGSILATMVGWVLYGACLGLKSLWDEFNMENPTEETRIISKLKGE